MYKFLHIVLILTTVQLLHAQEKPQTFTAQGITIELTATPTVAGEEMKVQFKITDANGTALSSLRPVAWIDQRQIGLPMDARICREKVQAYLQPSFSSRPTLDLNAYFILALNNEANISVIDPLSGFGGSKLYTLIPLKSPGEDWVLSDDNKRLYVSMPQVNQVAVIDIPTWKVIANVDAGATPTSVALQRDERYLWVGNDNDSASGVTVIDTATNKVAAQLKTGLGHHEIAFTDDDQLAFVTNKQTGTLSLIDIRKLAVLKDLEIGSQPAAIAFSSLSQTAYVANEGDGTIAAISAARHDVVARLQTDKGVSVISIPTAGHYGIALNTPGVVTLRR